MKQVKINAVLSNSDNETVNIESLATYNEKENKIIYTEEDLNVAITILKNN